MIMPKKYHDQAEKQRAYRERRAAEDAAGAVAKTILERPTCKLLTKIVRDLLRTGKATMPEICAAVVEGVRQSKLAVPAHTGKPLEQLDLERWIIEKSQS